MRTYIRNYVAGGTFFFTVVTHDRARILTSPLARGCLSTAIRQARAKWPFEVVGVVLLPDHLHTIWTLPPGDADFSLRMQKVKENFTKAYLAGGGHTGVPTLSQREHGERALWQPRFWEHTVRDEADLKRCADYVHWNPVKHGLVRRVVEYPWSTFHRYLKMGEYEATWGGEDPCPGFEMPE